MLMITYGLKFYKSWIFIITRSISLMARTARLHRADTGSIPVWTIFLNNQLPLKRFSALLRFSLNWPRLDDFLNSATLRRVSSVFFPSSVTFIKTFISKEGYF